ncbi:MAG: DUF445 domain-containing protein [Desulfurivibrionaceae bacterium]
MLQYLGPPVLGAFIGYMTNYVAIRMLFRPLRPWKVLGLKLPLTPGVIPAKRKQLAANIGEMVGEHLLTSEDVSRALQNKEFQEELGRLIDTKLENLLTRDLGSINEIIPEDLRIIYRANIRVLRLRLLSRLHAYLDSEDFAAMIDRLVTENSSRLFARQLDDAFPAEKREDFFNIFEELMSHLLASPVIQEITADIIKRETKTFLESRKSIADFVSRDLLTAILDRLEEEASPLLARLAELLKKPGIQKKISESIAGAAGHFTSSFGPLGSMLGSVLTPETIRKKITSFLEEKGETIGSWLESEEVREETARIIREKAEEFCNKPLIDYLENLNQEKIDDFIQEISGHIAGGLARPGIAEELTNFLRQALTSQEKKQVGEIAEDMLGAEGVADYQTRTTRAIVSAMRSSEAKGIADRVLVDVLEKKLLKKPIGPLNNLIPNKLRLSLRDYIIKWSSVILTQEVPNLIDSLNIRKIVSRKVDSLDLLKLEGLLMSIMQEQFKYINLFGGILGLIIGLLNLIFII